MTVIKYMMPLLSLFLVACQTTDRPQPVAAKEALENSIKADALKNATPPPPALPASVQQELASSGLLTGVAALPKSERRFDVSANGVEAKVFFSSLVQGTNLSVAVAPGVTGTISLALKGVTLSEALQVVEDMYGYEVSRQGRVLQIYPAGMRTETFPLNYLDMQRQGLSLTSVNSGRISDNDNSGDSSSSSDVSGDNNNNNDSSDSEGGSAATNGTFIRSKTKTDFWGELQKTLVSIVGSSGGGRQVVVSPQAGLVTVRAYPNELRQVRHFLNTAEEHLQRQVILEAKVLEVTLSDGYQQGIHWQQILGSAGHGGNTSIDFGTSGGTFGDQITNAIGGITTIGVKGADFAAMISLLDTQGDVDVLSSPRVTATNNQKAVIKVGKDEYFVTNVSSTTIAGSTTTSSTPQVQLTPFFSGIALDVTPQIDGTGDVLLHIHPSVIDVKEQTKEVELSADSILKLPLAQSEIRESDTVIKARSGSVVVIGGLMKTENRDVVSKVPLLGDIPFLGEAFTNRSKVKTKTELVILLKPTVVGNDTWAKELQRSKALLERWYPQEQ